MSRLAKSADPEVGRRYFVEEQMVAAPAAVLALAALAFGAHGPAAATIAEGFTSAWGSPDLWALLLVGVLSQGTGVFGGLVLLDARESSFCVPLNRASSVLAGVGCGARAHGLRRGRAFLARARGRRAPRGRHRGPLGGPAHRRETGREGHPLAARSLTRRSRA
jgi:hypothetical protein